jgi:hypothetical protein
MAWLSAGPRRTRGRATPLPTAAVTRGTRRRPRHRAPRRRRKRALPPPARHRCQARTHAIDLCHAMPCRPYGVAHSWRERDGGPRPTATIALLVAAYYSDKLLLASLHVTTAREICSLQRFFVSLIFFLLFLFNVLARTRQERG